MIFALTLSPIFTIMMIKDLSVQVHPATMLGWYDHDRKRNNGITVHLPLVLRAYFKCIEIKVGCSNTPQIVHKVTGYKVAL